MFTGLVEDVGELVAAETMAGGGLRLRVGSQLRDFVLGESISVDGVCLTVETFDTESFTVTAGQETLACTTMGEFAVGRRVNLERALALGDRLGGHMVSGHVDGVGEVTSVAWDEESLVLWTQAPKELARYIAQKGSICVDGVSLTVNEVSGAGFRVNIIPHTLSHTQVEGYKVGTRVNLEVDLVARYIERMLGERDE